MHTSVECSLFSVHRVNIQNDHESALNIKRRPSSFNELNAIKIKIPRKKILSSSIGHFHQNTSYTIQLIIIIIMISAEKNPLLSIDNNNSIRGYRTHKSRTKKFQLMRTMIDIVCTMDGEEKNIINFAFIND